MTSTDSDTIEVHEDNSGGVYLTRAGKTWSLGDGTWLVGNDDDPTPLAQRDASAWHRGEWDPAREPHASESSTDGLTLIARWRPCQDRQNACDGIFNLVLDERDDQPIAGAGGGTYCGVRPQEPSLDERVDRLAERVQRWADDRDGTTVDDGVTLRDAFVRVLTASYKNSGDQPRFTAWVTVEGWRTNRAVLIDAAPLVSLTGDHYGRLPGRCFTATVTIPHEGHATLADIRIA